MYLRFCRRKKQIQIIFKISDSTTLYVQKGLLEDQILYTLSGALSKSQKLFLFIS